MILITFPDGNKKEFGRGVSGLEIAKSISTSLTKEAICIKIDGILHDLSTKIEKDCSLEIITKKSPEALEILRHDAAHLLAQALKELFSEVKLAIGPVIENGFYYDFECEKHISTEDFAQIEKKMQELAAKKMPITREMWQKKDLLDYYRQKDDTYKIAIIENLPDEEFSAYRQDDFLDLCRGPHAPHTGFVKHFKLTKIAGAYWRGDSKNKMLQRIYGTLWGSETELKEHLTQLEEAKKRDHRILGKNLRLFHLQEEAIGQVFWHEKGMVIYAQIEKFIRENLGQNGYHEIKTPLLLDRKLWEKSGHWEKFKEHMFCLHDDDGRTLALKPMSCPAHVQIFNQRQVSYRDLPLRLSEFGTCHRNEPSGGLHGLMRVRSFVQDDAHIFCTEAQIAPETQAFCEMLQKVYAVFGFEAVKVKLATRPEVRAGSDEVWDKAESALQQAMQKMQLDFELNPGEGAFYGPKLEFVLQDCLKRDWQCGTLQVDLVMPERLQAFYIDSDGQKKHPVMIHRAIIGTFERFIGILIENYAGKFPLWLAPIQVVIMTISNRFDDYAKQIHAQLRDFRVELDLSAEKISYKLRKHSELKVPLSIIIGEKEADEQKISVRTLGSQKTETWSLPDFIKWLQNKIEKKELDY